MSRLSLPPTKSSLFLVKAQLAVAQDGHDLLEQKRELLVMELMNMLGETRVLEQDIKQRLHTAYPALRDMLFRTGRATADMISRDVHYAFALEEHPRVIAGIRFSLLEATIPQVSPQYSFSDSSADTDRTMMEFLELLRLLARMASVRAVVIRLAREVRKTQRRVNALEKMVIPQNRETLVWIRNVLEEQDLESFFSRKRLKSRAQKAPSKGARP